MSFAKDLSNFKSKLGNVLDERLKDVTNAEMARLEREVTMALRQSRATFWTRFAEELTRNTSVGKKGSADTKDKNVLFGGKADDGVTYAPAERVPWKGLSQKYLDWKLKYGNDKFFVKKGRLREKLMSYTPSETVSVRSFGDRWTRVFGPVKVFIGRVRQQKRRNKEVPYRSLTVRVVPMSRFPTMPRGDTGLEKQIFSTGNYDPMLYNKLVNFSKGFATHRRPALLPYTRWWIQSASRQAVAKALAKMRAK